MRKKNIQRLTNTDKILATETAKDPKKVNILHSGMLVITDYLLFSKNAGVKIGLPLHVREPRFLLVTSGEAEVEVNNVSMHLHQNTVMFVPENGTMEIQSKSDDFNGCGFVFDHRMSEHNHEKLSLPFVMTVSEKEAEMLKQSLHLLRILFSLPEDEAKLTKYLVSFFVDYLSGLCRKFFAEHQRPTRALCLFNEFTALVNQYAIREKSVAYYAGMLGITSNYLSVLVREQSHRSAKEWIEMAVIREAKILLDETNDTQAEIAAVLGFCSATQFGSFFRKHTGMTPRAYRYIDGSGEEEEQ